jgi:DNA-binding LacI/PurR family transcriptional regulator
MMGIFRRIGATDKFDIRIISNEDSLCDLLTAENSAERPDGIISGVPYSERTKEIIAASGLPFVGIGMSEGDIAARSGNSGFVLNDNEGIGRAAAGHFLSLSGFRSFAYVPDARGRAWSALRGSSFAAALRAAGKNCETYGGDGGDTAQLSAFLASLPRPAAVLAAWDGRAADVIHAAHKARIVVRTTSPFLAWTTTS